MFTLSVYAQVAHDPLADSNSGASLALLDNDADLIYAASDQLSDSGYTSLTVHPDTMSIDLRWVGPVPTAVQAAIGQIALGGVVVNLLSSNVSLEDQNADIAAIVAGYQQLGFTGNSLLEPEPDGSGGIDVYIDGTATDQLRQLWAAHHVATVTENYPIDETSGRQADVSPYWAGMRIQVGTYASGTWHLYDECSAAFGVHDNRNHYLLSAAHCGSPMYVVRNGAGYKFGQVSAYAPSDVGADDMTVFVNPPETSGYDAWAGPWNTTSAYRQVIGSLGNSNGDFVCSSGSYLGEACNLKITNNNATAYIQNNSYKVVLAKNQSGQAAVCKGDSGGPVYAVTSGPGTRYDYAKGVISLGAGSVAPTAGAGGTCYQQVAYRDVRKVLSEFRVSLN